MTYLLVKSTLTVLESKQLQRGVQLNILLGTVNSHAVEVL
jgi:hypothetical protein